MPKEESMNNLRFYQKLYNRNRNSIVFSSLAEEYRERGMITEAIQTSLEGLGQFPDCVSARTTLALCYMDRGDLIGAQRELENIISSGSDLLYPLKLLLKCYERNGEKEKVLQIAKHILKKYPFDYELDLKVKELEKQRLKIFTLESREEITEVAQNFEIKNISSLFENIEPPQKKINGKKGKKIALLSNMLSKLRGITNGA